LTAEKQRGTTSKKAEIKEVWLERIIQFESIYAMYAWLDMIGEKYYKVTWVDAVNNQVKVQWKILVRNDADLDMVKSNLERWYKTEIKVVQ
jgi:hypothetical protein